MLSRLSPAEGDTHTVTHTLSGELPAMRNSSPETCWVRLSSQKKPTDATMLPHSKTAAAMPRKPAVMRRRSEGGYTQYTHITHAHKHRVLPW